MSTTPTSESGQPVRRVTVTFLSGLPAGDPRIPRFVSVQDGAIVAERGTGWPWKKAYAREFAIPAADVAAIQVADSESISAGRVFMTGLVGLVWKKKRHYLLISYPQNGVDSTLVIEPYGGTQAGDLERLRQAIVAAKGARPI